MGTRYTNDDGLTHKYGTRTASESGTYSKVVDAGMMKQLICDFTWDDLPGFDADASGGSTPDSFSDAAVFIPANSIIKDVLLLCTSAFTGTTTFDIGLYQKDGTVIDIDCFYDGIDIDGTSGLDTAGNVLVPNGNGPAQNTSGTYDLDFNEAIASNVDMYVVVTDVSGTLTAGEARLVVEFIPPHDDL